MPQIVEPQALKSRITSSPLEGLAHRDRLQRLSPGMAEDKIAIPGK